MIPQQEQQIRYVRFSTNVLEEVALKFATGLPAPSNKPGYADQVRYTVFRPDGGEAQMYVAPFTAELIAKEGLKPGEWFKVGKVESRNGQRRGIEWRVQRIEQAPVENKLERDLRMSAENAAAQKAGRPLPHRVAPERSGSAQSRPAQQSSPVVGQPPAAPPSPVARAATPSTAPSGSRQNSTPGPPLKIPFDLAMTKFLIIAGRATREAEKILGSEGGSVRFDSRDVAALATTLLIQAAHGQWLTPCADWPRGSDPAVP